MLLQTLIAKHDYYCNLFEYLIIIQIIAIIILIVAYKKRAKKYYNEHIRLLQEHTAKIDSIRKTHTETLEKLRIEMLKNENERTRQWIESEKETLHVLSGVATLIDLSEKINKIELDKIIQLLNEIKTKLNAN